MVLDELDLKVLEENFDQELINQINYDNLFKIFTYLEENGIYYAKDLFLSSLDLFLLPSSEFVARFERLKNKLGNDFVDKLGDDCSLIEIMYEE
ncbi:MAG: hypothetical protein ACI31R_01655 [Bacilli bacterium]